MVAREEPTLDLDALEREGAELGPFNFVLGGREYSLASPEELDYRDLVAAMVAGGNRDLITAMNKLLDDEDQSEFWENKIPAFKMEALVRGYMKHYELAPDSGKPRASSASSRGTARRSRPTSRSAA